MMILGKAFEKLVDGSPVCVMIRGSLEYALSEEFVNEIFGIHSNASDYHDSRIEISVVVLARSSPKDMDVSFPPPNSRFDLSV